VEIRVLLGGKVLWFGRKNTKRGLSANSKFAINLDLAKYKIERERGEDEEVGR
jgi:hypothetical protein